MSNHSMKSPEDQRRAERPQGGRHTQPFDLQEVLRRARSEALGTLAPHSF